MTGINFSSWYNNSEGTIYSEAKCTTNPNINFVGIITNAVDGGTSYIDVARYQPTLKVDIQNAGSQAFFDTGLTSASSHKLALAYKVNDFAVSADGATVLTDTSGTVPAANRLYIGSIGTLYFLNGTIKKIAYYPIRVTNTNLVALTGT
jgi:hypothetical protein